MGSHQLVPYLSTCFVPHYAQRLKAGIEVERPIALGVLKIKAKIGELMPAKTKSEAGYLGGKGEKASSVGEPAFAKEAILGYRLSKQFLNLSASIFRRLQDEPLQGQ